MNKYKQPRMSSELFVSSQNGALSLQNIGPSHPHENTEPTDIYFVYYLWSVQPSGAESFL